MGVFRVEGVRPLCDRIEALYYARVIVRRSLAAHARAARTGHRPAARFVAADTEALSLAPETVDLVFLFVAEPLTRVSTGVCSVARAERKSW